MSNNAKAVTEKLLECAKSEFLEKGFENASLRIIAQKAGSSKSAIYRRYPDKASLFGALVNNIADETVELIHNCYEEFLHKPGVEQLKELQKMSDSNFRMFTDYIYQHFDDFKLLISCSDSTVLSNFIQRISEEEVNNTLKFITTYGSDSISKGILTRDFIQLVSEAYFTGIFQVIVHDMPREKGETHLKRIRDFFYAGWMTILKDLSF